MQRDPRAYLWDVREATDAIGRFVTGKTYADYTGDLLLRSAIERQFEIIGEALGQLSKAAPALAGRIPNLAEIVAFRNLLIHGYAGINHMLVWRTIEESLPQLQTTVAGLLDELGGP